MEKVLKDKSLQHYQGKFPTKPKEKIAKSYSCHTYIPKDTSLVDSTALIGIDSLQLEQPVEVPVEIGQ